MHLDDVVTELVEHCGDRLLRVAYQLTHDAAAAQDLVQEALLRVYQSVRHRGLAPEDWYAYLRRALEQASPHRHRPGWYVPFAVAAAVAAVVAGSVWVGGLLGGHKPVQTSGGAIPVQRLLSCPVSYAHQAPWVPAKPAGGLASLASQLTWKPHSPQQPIAYTAVGGPRTNYLIGLAYPGGARIW